MPGFERFVIAVACGFAAVRLLRAMRTPLNLAAPAVILAAFVTIQITLGVLTVMLRKPADVASAHVAAGALTLVTAFVMTVRSFRLFAKRQAAAERREALNESFESGLVVA